MKNKLFEEFIGGVAFEDDGGWSKEVWDHAWDACLIYVIKSLGKNDEQLSDE
jgi:hypothetical protein